jgi:hypothetical protein
MCGRMEPCILGAPLHHVGASEVMHALGCSWHPPRSAKSVLGYESSKWSGSLLASFQFFQSTGLPQFWVPGQPGHLRQKTLPGTCQCNHDASFRTTFNVMILLLSVSCQRADRAECSITLARTHDFCFAVALFCLRLR